MKGVGWGEEMVERERERMKGWGGERKWWRERERVDEAGGGGRGNGGERERESG